MLVRGRPTKWHPGEFERRGLVAQRRPAPRSTRGVRMRLKWTEQDEREIMRHAGEPGFAEAFAARKGRTVAAVNKKAHELRRRAGIAPRVRKAWTEEERVEVAARFLEPGYAEDFAKRTGRAVQSVIKKGYEFRKAGY